MKKKEPVTVIRVREVERQLPVDLTNDELIDRGGRLATVQQDIDNEEASQAEQKSAMKARLSALEAERARLTSIVARRKESRPVQVYITHDYVGGRYQEVRSDTGEVVFERHLTEDERQQRLPVE